MVEALDLQEGDDIEIQLPIAVWEAALGAQVETPTIDGKTLIKIPRGAKTGQKFRLREMAVELLGRQADAAEETA